MPVDGYAKRWDRHHPVAQPVALTEFEALIPDSPDATVRFSLDGINYEIDVISKHAKEPRIAPDKVRWRRRHGWPSESDVPRRGHLQE